MRLREIKILQDTPSSFFGITMPLLKQEGRGGDKKKKKSNINFTMCREVKKKKQKQQFSTHETESIRYLYQSHK